MTAREREYDGMDALMAALVDEPLPDSARRDAEFMTAHGAAAADLALLRERLVSIGDTLAGDLAERTAGALPEGLEESEGVEEPEGLEELEGPQESEGSAGQASSVTSLAGRRGRARPLTLALRGLAAAAAVTVVMGMGWLVVQSAGGAADDSAGSSAADTASQPQHREESGKLGHAGYLACARLVVEGTVAEVEPAPGTGQNRVSLDVQRYYKPATGEDRVVFPTERDVRPGAHLLVGITHGQAEPDLWAAGEKEIARERAWITAALPQSRTLPCP